MKLLGRVVLNYATRSKVEIRALVTGRGLEVRESMASLPVARNARNHVIRLARRLCVFDVRQGEIVFVRQASVEEIEALEKVV